MPTSPAPQLFPPSHRNATNVRNHQTSALDTHTEQALLSHINSLVKEKKRTSVFVAHRLRTIYDSDVIIVLRDGNVAELGTHEKLIDRAGLYSELWSKQETMFVDKDVAVEEETK